MVTEKHWIKTRTIIRRLVDEMISLRKVSEQEDGSLILSQGVDHNALESDRGFLVYVSQTDIPLYGPISEGDPSEPGQLAEGMERGWLEKVDEGNGVTEKELRCII
jgi:hypothetical protein